MIDKAKPPDIGRIKELIDQHASKGKMISRSLSYLYENLRDYFVYEKGKKIIGCGALHIVWADLAEIKSLAVDSRHLRKGIGKALVQACIDEAAALGLQKVFTLTMEPDFFIKLGFKVIPKDELPMKIWGECMHCNKYPKCDETAMVYAIK